MDDLVETESVSRDEAVLRALQSYQDKLRAERAEHDAGWDEVFRMARGMAASYLKPKRTSNHDWLYDENGLPV